MNINIELLPCDEIPDLDTRYSSSQTRIKYIEIPQGLERSYLDLYERYRGIRHPHFAQVLGIIKHQSKYYIACEDYDSRIFEAKCRVESTQISEKMIWISEICSLLCYCKTKLIDFIYISIDSLSLSGQNIKVLPTFYSNLSRKPSLQKEILESSSESSGMLLIGVLMYKVFCDMNYNPENVSDIEHLPLIDPNFEASHPMITQIIRELLCPDPQYRISLQKLKEHLDSYLENFNIS